MGFDKDKKTPPASQSDLLNRITELQNQLDRISSQRDEAYELAKEASSRAMERDAENKDLRRRISELEDPQKRHGRGLGWIGKAVHVLKQSGRPMRAQEIIHELRARDKEGLLQFTDDPENLLSSVLSKAKKLGRLKLFKVAGTRGGYYAIEDWVDEAGKLIPEMKAQLL